MSTAPDKHYRNFPEIEALHLATPDIDAVLDEMLGFELGRLAESLDCETIGCAELADALMISFDLLVLLRKLKTLPVSINAVDSGLEIDVLRCT